MSIEISKDSLDNARVAFCIIVRNVQNEDFIVPDTKPDMQSVIHIEALPKVESINTVSGKATVQGIIDYTFIYRAEDPVGQQFQAFTCSAPFTSVIEDPCITTEMESIVKCEIEHIEPTVRNGRKINTRTILAVDFSFLEISPLDIPIDLSGIENIHTLKASAAGNICSKAVSGDVDITAQLPIPPGKPAAAEIIMNRICVRSAECEAHENGVDITGYIDATTFYISDDEPATIQILESEIPVRKNTGLDNIDETGICIPYNLRLDNITVSLGEDSDGDMRMINIEGSLSFNVFLYKQKSIDYIKDAYSLDTAFKIEASEASADVLFNHIQSQISGRDILSPDQDSPDISDVIHSWCIPKLTSVNASEGRVTLEGFFDVSTAYTPLLTDDQSVNTESNAAENLLALEIFTKQIAFKQSVDIKGLTASMKPHVLFDAGNLSYSMISPTEIDARVSAPAKIIITDYVKIPVICDVTPSADSVHAKHIAGKIRPSLYIYFTQPGDSLWNVAKKYRVPVDKLKEYNDIGENSDISAEFPTAGSQIIVYS